jgi:hypothetical protein
MWLTKETYLRCYVWQYLILFLGFLVILWASVLYFTAPNLEKFILKSNPELVSIENILENSKTGDLLFFAGYTFAERSIRRYHNSYYNHCCLIFRDLDEHGKDIPYIFESDLGQGYREGPRVMKLVDKLARWKGMPYVCWRKYIPPNHDEKLRPTGEDVRNIAQNYIKYDFDKSMVGWLFSKYPDSRLYKYFKPPKSVFCSEMVALTLQKLGILPDDYIPGYFTPEDFAGTSLTMIKGFYGSPRYFKI